MKQISIIITLLAIFLISCKDPALEPVSQNSLVIEGWIENGYYPVVFVTRSLPVSYDSQSTFDIANCVERWAKVTVSDGEMTETLYGVADYSTIPPFYYTSSFLVGEAGKTYTLTVISKTDTITATTTIPQADAYADSITVEPSEHCDTLFNVYAYMPRQESHFFQLFVRNFTIKDKYFLSSFLGAFTNNELPLEGNRKLPVNNSRREFFSNDNYQVSFPKGAQIKVKVSAMEEEAYNFWKAYDSMLSLSRNPIFPNNDNLPTNISNGYGYWIGYASTIYNVEL